MSTKYKFDNFQFSEDEVCYAIENNIINPNIFYEKVLKRKCNYDGDTHEIYDTIFCSKNTSNEMVITIIKDLIQYFSPNWHHNGMLGKPLRHRLNNILESLLEIIRYNASEWYLILECMGPFSYDILKRVLEYHKKFNLQSKLVLAYHKLINSQSHHILAVFIKNTDDIDRVFEDYPEFLAKEYSAGISFCNTSLDNLRRLGYTDVRCFRNYIHKYPHMIKHIWYKSWILDTTKQLLRQKIEENVLESWTLEDWEYISAFGNLSFSFVCNNYDKILLTEWGPLAWKTYLEVFQYQHFKKYHSVLASIVDSPPTKLLPFGGVGFQESAAVIVRFSTDHH